MKGVLLKAKISPFQALNNTNCLQWNVEMKTGVLFKRVVKKCVDVRDDVDLDNFIGKKVKF